MKVSVIIPSWNGKAFLNVCLTSLRRQTFKDFDIIVVDNNSTDNTVPFLKQNFPEVEIIQLSTNRGFSIAVNIGIRTSNAEYVALLNQDTEVDPKWLEELVNVLDKHPDIDFCASKLMRFDNRNIIDSAGDGYSRAGYPYKIGAGEKDNHRFQEQRRVFGACAAAAIYRRSLFESVGLFDDDIGDYSTDVDINFRAQLIGLNCYFVPTAIVYHRVAGSTDIGSARFIHRINRNAVLVFLKNYPTKLMLKNIVKIATLFLSTLLRWPHPWAAVTGRLDAMKLLPSILKKREEIQRRRVVSLGKLNSMMSVK